MRFTVYGQPVPPDRCTLHPEEAQGEYGVCARCEDLAWEAAQASLAGDEPGSPYRWSDGTPVDPAELAAQVAEDRRFDMTRDEHGGGCCDE